MKKLLFILGTLFSLSTMSVYAEQTRAEVYIWNHGSIMNSRERSPAYLPTIDIVYDSILSSIEIISSIDCDATVFIYDATGNLIKSSDSLDTILPIEGINSSIIFVRIESNYWYATATIDV